MLNHKLKLYLLYLIFTSTPVFAASQAEINNPPLPNESPADYDFRMYARTFGVSIQEAKRRFYLRQKIGNLEEKLRQDNPDTFAGLWLEHSPKYRLVSKFTTTPKKAISAYADAEVAAVTDVEPAAVSLAGLEKMRQEALEAVASEGNIPIESDIDVMKNRVELYVLEKDHLKSTNAVKRRGMQFPRNVEVIKISSFSKRERVVINGGQPLGPECTTGFSVKSISTLSGAPVGTRGITTASHCTNTLTYNGVALTWKKGIDSGSYDIQWHTAPSSYIPTNLIQYSSLGLYRPITATKSRNAQVIGEYVCKFGRITGYTCGNIRSKTWQPLYHVNNEGSHTHAPTFIIVSHTASSPDLSSAGDSGGPWYGYGSNIAYGTHVGDLPPPIPPFPYGPNDATYMAIDYLSGLGVAVLTTP